MIKDEDLIGHIKNFPKEVVEKMIEYQVKQGNNEDIEVFQYNIRNIKDAGGFNWSNTKEGLDFWTDVVNGNFDIFFEKFPVESLESDIILLAKTLSDKHPDISPSLIKSVIDEAILIKDKWDINKWISVEAELPEERVQVITKSNFEGENVYAIQFIFQGKWYGNMLHPTYWKHI